MSLFFGHPLHFGALSDHIDHFERRPVGIGKRMLPVAVLKEDSWQPSQMIGWNGDAKSGDEILEGIFGGCKIVFGKACEAAFVRKSQEGTAKPRLGIPINTYHLRQAGAFRLNQLLGLSVIPHTELVDMPGRKLPAPNPDSPRTDQARRLFEFWAPKRIFGTIQDWVRGTRLDDMRYFYDGSMDGLKCMRHKLFEAYIYTVVAWDPDQHDGNVIERESDSHMTLVDTNLSGSDPENEEMDKRLNELPLLYEIDGSRIPDEYLAKLQGFVDNEDLNMEILSPYYGRETTAQFFTRARYLLNNPVVESLRTVKSHLLSDRQDRTSRPLRQPEIHR